MKIPNLAHFQLAAVIVIAACGCGPAVCQAEPASPAQGDQVGNGGEITDRFTVSLIDQMIECVNAAREDDTTATMVQRARILSSLRVALESMFDSESGGRQSMGIGEFLAKRKETRRSLGLLIDLYSFHAKVSDKEDVGGTPAVVLRKSIADLKTLRESVAGFRSRVDRSRERAHYPQPADGRGPPGGMG